MTRLQTRLLLIVLLAMAPALAFQVHTEIEARHVRRTLMEDEALRSMRLVRSEVERIAEGAEEVLSTIGSAPMIQDGMADQCKLLLRNLVHLSPRYVDAAAIDTNGQILCQSGPADRRLSEAEQAATRWAMATGGFVVGAFSPPEAGPNGSGRAILPMVKPFANRAGQIGGVVEVALDVGWLGGALQRLALPPGANAVIADRRGTLLARTPPDPALVGKPLPPTSRFMLDGTSVQVAAFTTHQGRQVIAAYSPPDADPEGLLFKVGLDRNLSFASLTQANWIGLTLVFLGVVLAMATTSLLGTRLIGRPVNRLLAAAGRWRTGALTARAGLRDDGSEFGRLGVAFDDMAAALAAREAASRASEAALRRLTEDLESRVRLEVAAREQAQSRAAHAERMQALGQLAGGIAHDFNNVLQTITGAATLIEARAADTGDIARLTRLVIDAAGRGASVTRRLLAFARRADLRIERLDAAALLSGLREVLAYSLGDTIDVRLDLDPGLGPIFADKGQLETALLNIASNARDAMPQGGILCLAVATETVDGTGSTHPAGLAAGTYARFTITDTGTGMDAGTLAKASEPFFTTKNLGVGTGLGLSMAKGFAEQSGGALAIDSVPGQGTVVTLWLAQSDQAWRAVPTGHPAADSNAVSVEERPLLSGRVLLVDDEDVLRGLIAEHLEEAGYDVVVAAGGAEALALLSAGEEVDAIVTDLSMPGMDGLALIRAARETRPETPAVLLTGYAGDTVVLPDEDDEGGALTLLRKPVHVRDLIDHIDIVTARTRPD